MSEADHLLDQGGYAEPAGSRRAHAKGIGWTMHRAEAARKRQQSFMTQIIVQFNNYSATAAGFLYCEF